MHIRRRKSFFQLYEIIRQVEADPSDVAAVLQCNLLVLNEILHAEEALRRHRDRHRELIRELKVGRRDKVDTKLIRTRIKRVASNSKSQENAIFIWKCFGDALAFLFLDRFSIKHGFFEIDQLGVKHGAGFLSGKYGLNGEVALLHEAASHGIPAVLCDITNVLRYGDVCLLGASDPALIEVKSSKRLNQRAKRQLQKLELLHSFLETDRADSFRGMEGPVARIALSIPLRDNVEALNTCIAEAQATGQSILHPEPGVRYIAIYGKPDYEAIFGDIGQNFGTCFLLNADKNDHEWAPYLPFLLSIRERDHVLDFIEGRLFLIVLIDWQPLCDAMSDDEWMVRYREHPDYPIQCVHRSTLAYMAISRQFIARAAYEFVSVGWIAEAQRPSIENLDFAFVDPNLNGAPADHVARLREFLGDNDPWLEELGLS